MFRLLHQLLPTKERLHRIQPATASTCRLCQLNLTEDLLHSFFICPFNRDFGIAMLEKLQPLDRTLTKEKLLLLDISLQDEDMELPIVWFTAANLFHIWECRVSGKRAKLFSIRSEVESRIALLRETQFHDSAETILEILNTEV